MSHLHYRIYYLAQFPMVIVPSALQYPIVDRDNLIQWVKN